jgi:outer membrane protein
VVRFVVAVAFLLGGLVPAAVAAADAKVGFVNVAKLLEDAPQAADARVKLEKEFGPRDRDLVVAQREIRQLEDRLVRESSGITAVERSNLELDLRTRRREVKRQQDEFRDELNIRRNQELAALQRLVIEAVQELAKQDGYDLVMTEGVVYASSRVDLTEKVLERLRREAGRKASGE